MQVELEVQPGGCISVGFATSTAIGLSGASVAVSAGDIVISGGSFDYALTGLGVAAATGTMSVIVYDSTWTPVNDANPNGWIPVVDTSPNVWVS